jgi:hypothetical protein
MNESLLIKVDNQNNTDVSFFCSQSTDIVPNIIKIFWKMKNYTHVFVSNFNTDARTQFVFFKG